MTTSRQHDFLNRLTTIASAPTGASAVGYTYSYNQANQRVRTTLADGSYWSYEYDAPGQVKSGKRYWNDGTPSTGSGQGPVAGQHFEYGFDDIGNRSNAKTGGDHNGAGLRSASSTLNALNQITQRTVPGVADVLGAAKATASVTVNSVAVTVRKGEYYWKELAINNGTAAQWQSVTVVAIEGANQTPATGNLFLPKTPESFAYDADGNLTNDGRWAYSWDAENRVVRMVANTSADPQQRIDFVYDWRGRRIGKKVWTNTAGTDPAALDEKYVYDGWNLLAVLNATNHNVIASFLWGTDLSGSLQGAGGVGGLLAVSDANGAHFATYDGNGNVTALVKATDGTISATYEYGPFGELIRASGPEAKANPFRFSTKYQDDETDLLYYGYRYYSASMGRWLSRDPLGETGGKNLYGFALNNSVSSVDKLGQQVIKPPPPRGNDPIFPLFPEDPYQGYNWLVPVETYNCAGIAFRTYDYPSKGEAKKKLAAGREIDCSQDCAPCDLKFWLWEYSRAFQAQDGTMLDAWNDEEWHLVGAPVSCEDGKELRNCYCKNGRRPVQGPVLPSRQRPPEKELATTNSNPPTPRRLRNGETYFVIRKDFKETCYCLPPPKRK